MQTDGVQADGSAPLVTVFGGTGFIGTPTVEKLRAAGWRVRVAARSAKPIDGVEAVRADIADPASVARAVAGARCVVNLAHGGGGENYQAVRAAMLGGALNVARAAREAGVERLVHVGSIAGLYLGDPASVIDGATPPDPEKETRALYARVKAETDLALSSFARESGLALVLLRPGLVVGAGTSPFHSGVGFQNNEQHEIGWNDGRNELPFVLVDDVGEAIVAATRAPAAPGHAYNLVGDVRLTARDYIAELARALDRPIRFHPRSVTGLHAGEVGKWAIKLAARRAGNVFPSKRDLHSRGLVAKFDTEDAKRDLAWKPVADRAEFVRQAIAPHATPFEREVASSPDASVSGDFVARSGDFVADPAPGSSPGQAPRGENVQSAA
jgi:nucleoside-diphosphate-sugar epimerase